MDLYGLIGYPLSHSFSAAYFTRKFETEHIDAAYKLFPLPHIEDLPDLIQAQTQLQGFNVTIPHKISMLPFLHTLSPEALDTGAVNCVKINRNNQHIELKGYNTDIYGFELSLKPLLGNMHTHALILGSGGAAKAVAYVLKKLGINFLQVSRNPKTTNHIDYKDITEEIISTHKLIIHTTPLGMYPETENFPDIPYHLLRNEHVLYDLVYNPEETMFLKKGKAAGAICKNGMEMLTLQAEKSWGIWNNT